MKVYLVGSAMLNWMRTGYGAALLEAEVTDVLVSFAEHTKPGNERGLDIGDLPAYQPPAAE